MEGIMKSMKGWRLMLKTLSIWWILLILIGASVFFYGNRVIKNTPVISEEVQNISSAQYYKIMMEPSQKDAETAEQTITGPINAPLINQLPQLDRGCEVTSLAMLLQSAGIKVDKVTLAKQLKKDPTPYSFKNGQTYFGNPNVGFVGDMYSDVRPGYGVYHGPLVALAKTYLGNRVIDLTGEGFSAIENQLDQGIPVVVITSVTYHAVPSSEWMTWRTPNGTFRGTKKEHAVLITGYSKNELYFNDPLKSKKNFMTNRQAFLKAWAQFGSQAISYER